MSWSRLRILVLIVAAALVFVAVQVARPGGSRAAVPAAVSDAPAPAAAVHARIAASAGERTPTSAPAPPRTAGPSEIGAFEAFLASQPSDAASARAEADVVAFLAHGDLPTTRLLGAHCGATACRVEMAHATDEDREAVVLALSRAPAFRANLRVFHLEAEPPAVRTVVFLARPDFHFGRNGRTERTDAPAATSSEP